MPDILQILKYYNTVEQSTINIVNHNLQVALNRRKPVTDRVDRCVCCNAITARVDSKVSDMFLCSSSCSQTMINRFRDNPLPIYTLLEVADISNNRHAIESLMHHTSTVPVRFTLSDRLGWLRGDITWPKVVHRPAVPTTSPTCGRCKVAPRPYNSSTARFKRWCDKCAVLPPTYKDKKIPKDRLPPPNKNNDIRLNDPEWLYNMHVHQQHTKSSIARMLGVDKETITNRFKRFSITAVRHTNIAREQQDVVDWLISMGVEVEQNITWLTSPKQIDIFLPSHNIAIEYCGLYWHSTSQERITPSYHKQKMSQCNKQGVTLITLFSDEWLNHQHLVKRMILHRLNMSADETVAARVTEAVELTTAQKNEFFNTHHIQSTGPGSIALGLVFESTIVAAMTFIKQSNECYVLNRFATSCNVPGGFSKLLVEFKRRYPTWARIVSFADLRWSSGEVYKRHGFVLEAVLPPDYEYTKGLERIHKSNFRHSRLSARLGEMYDSSLSETENTLKAGWFKIFNCGLQRWVMERNN